MKVLAFFRVSFSSLRNEKRGVVQLREELDNELIFCKTCNRDFFLIILTVFA
jgi:hypothetical protein